jgi:hypothetical protein
MTAALCSADLARTCLQNVSSVFYVFWLTTCYQVNLPDNPDTEQKKRLFCLISISALFTARQHRTCSVLQCQADCGKTENRSFSDRITGLT